MSSYLPLNSSNVMSLREQFPALGNLNNGLSPVYFDGPGGTQLPTSVIEGFGAYLQHGNSNLGGRFSVSENTVSLVDVCRQKAAALFGASSKDEIVFGANMTTMAFHFSRAISQDWQAGDEIILSDADHGANRSSWAMAAEDKGVTVHYVPIKDASCNLDLEVFQSLLNEKTRLVAMTAASNLSGTFVDIKKVTDLAKANGSVVFIDAVHLLPHQILNVQKLGADFVAGSAYKFFGPHLGVLFGRQALLEKYRPYKVEPAPTYAPNCWETGTLNFEALSAFSGAIDYLASLGEGPSLRAQLESAYGNIHQYETSLSSYFLERLNEFPTIELLGESGTDNRTATFALRFGEVDPAKVATHLGEHEIYTWSGHLYADRLTDALGVTQKGGILRVGLMHYNTKEEIDRFFQVLSDMFV
ncbi:cysteine desulfurase-like protein [Vibrio genomosp. F10]|uniref:Cysteine desulfurase-like protein n=1 Tax=Vibrio genomosp. F10 TaxID=723171 RepID=A0A1B9R1Y1_9VIBR|nr:cysteine desulfurase-like protein [Vibrio genomosp. F10]OCH78250.1 cysteine desulfurase-like protein [Vibrio genomosp. F10]OEF05394.1 cysteine desulfurase-like protein [Vibrio genomosp. F10 str. 9ZB36]